MPKPTSQSQSRRSMRDDEQHVRAREQARRAAADARLARRHLEAERRAARAGTACSARSSSRRGDGRRAWPAGSRVEADGQPHLHVEILERDRRTCARWSARSVVERRRTAGVEAYPLEIASQIEGIVHRSRRPARAPAGAPSAGRTARGLEGRPRRAPRAARRQNQFRTCPATMRAASDIMSFVHGGSQTMSTVQSLTPSSALTL